MKAPFVAILFLFTLHASSQNPQCTSQEFEQMNRENVAAFLKFKSSPGYAAFRTNATPIVVPVVIHVVNNDIYVAQYSPDATLLNMINKLNIYYAKQNADTSTIPVAFQPLSAASGISFCLAATDPVGNPTTGIVRVPSSHGPFYSTQANELMTSSLGGDDAWPFTKYLNIYVCALDPGHLGFAGHGYSAVSYIALSSTTLTHETGHSFGLAHTWGGSPYSCSDDDGIADTPLEWGPASGTPAFPLYDACTTTGDGIMYMNLMDYAQQRTMFTADQVALMEYTLTTNSDYISMISTNNCQTVGVESVSSASLIRLYPNPAHGVLNVECRMSRGLGIELKVYDVMGQLVFEEKTHFPFSTFHFQLAGGIYFVRVSDGDKVWLQKLVIE